MVSSEKPAKKKAYFQRLLNLVQSYSKIFIVLLDHVGSKQMADIRSALRKDAVVLMGKNTMIRTALKQHVSQMPQLEKLINCVKLNVGFVFCISDPAKIRHIIAQHTVPAPARQGVIAPVDVVIPSGPTGMDPSQTSFFQALGIATKIAKAQIEIQNDVHVIKKGDKVSASQSVLLQKLNIKPFSYGLNVKYVYDDGIVYDAAVLDITNEDIRFRIVTGISYMAAFSRQVGFPTQASIRHSIVEGFRNCVALVININFSFPELEAIKKAMECEQRTTLPITSEAPMDEIKKGTAGSKFAEKEDEEEEDMGFSLFD